MDKYPCPKPDTSLPIGLVEYTYPEIDIASCGFRFRIKELKKEELKSEIKETPQNEHYINKFMLNYFLGAQLDYKDRKPKYY